MTSFEDLDLNDRLLNAIGNLGFVEPTQIQVGSIPPILAGKDVIGESATGSGKTLAFGCGIVEHGIRGNGIQALVLTPTRELSEQIKESLRQLSSQNPLSIIAVYGGVSIHKQIKSLKRADVVIATPGRLLDHLRRKTMDLSHVRLLVLDEADRMFDMGFIDDVEKIITKCSTRRQTLFFSATISSRVNKLAYNHMVDPVKVFAENQVKPEKLKQVYYDVPKGMKLSLLTHLLQNEDSELAMVFCNTRKTTDFVVKNLRSFHIKAVAIHGGLSQKNRTRTIASFNDAKENVLVCTDVAARGLHINNVSHIYNFECPMVPNDYVHRIGRTARAGEEGKVINLLCKLDKKPFSKIRSRYPNFTIENVYRPKISQLTAIGTGKSHGNRSTSPNNQTCEVRENRSQRKHHQIHNKNSEIISRQIEKYKRDPEHGNKPGQKYRHQRGGTKTGYKQRNNKTGYKPRNNKPGNGTHIHQKPYPGSPSKEGSKTGYHKTSHGKNPKARNYVPTSRRKYSHKKK